MASGWDQATKKVIRFNGRNSGNNIWDQDATDGQVIDSQGHDTNDQTLADSITETVNINGWNAMLADFSFGGFKGIALADGQEATDAVNKGQLDALVSGQSWDGESLTLNTANGNFETALSPMNSIKSGAIIRHILPATGTQFINVNDFNRHYVANTGATTLTFQQLPSVTDPDLGDYYQVEGQVLVFNGTNAGDVTIAGITPTVLMGAPSQVDDQGSILTYLIQYINGSIQSMFVWSAG